MAYQPDRWWQQHEFWLNCPPYHSETEQEAIWSLFAQAYGLMAVRLARAVRLYRAEMSLRDLQLRQDGGRSA
jgi:hypothetical protein